MSGIIAITASGICPFKLDNFKLPELVIGAAAGAAGVELPNNLPQVPSPTIPSAFNPLADCHALTAASVLGPNLPMASIPNFSWSFFTSSPSDPIFNSIVYCFIVNYYSCTLRS